MATRFTPNFPLKVAQQPREGLDQTLTFRRADGSLTALRHESESGELTTCDLGIRWRQPRPMHIDGSVLSDNNWPIKQLRHLEVKTTSSFPVAGRNRPQCSVCRRPIYSPPVGQGATVPNADDSSQSGRPDATAALPPGRVFRSVIMSEVNEPLRPRTRDGLIEAFAQSLEGQPPSRVEPGPHTVQFEMFPFLPFELRRLVWEMALPRRLLLLRDLSRQYRNDFVASCPQPHSVNELWRSDLFYVCRESRHVVEAYERGGRRAGLTSEAKLLSSLDILYCPWEGRNSDRWTLELCRLGLPLRRIALDLEWLENHDKDALEWLAFDESLRRVDFVVAAYAVQVQVPVRSDASIYADAHGTNFTTLVDLYDDGRIQEVFQLHNRLPASGSKLGRMARHVCVSCARRAWEARKWDRFGQLFGQRLQKMSRPGILVSVAISLGHGQVC